MLLSVLGQTHEKEAVCNLAEDSPELNLAGTLTSDFQPPYYGNYISIYKSLSLRDFVMWPKLTMTTIIAVSSASLDGALFSMVCKLLHKQGEDGL